MNIEEGGGVVPQVKLQKKYGLAHKRSYRLQEERINQMIQIEASELYERVDWMFGGTLSELLAPEVMESKELH
jgi:hypothetical protein